MRVIRLLALRRLRLQPMRAVLAAVVVGGGTSLVVTILVLSGSLSTSVTEAARALAGPAPLRVLGPMQRGGIDTDAIATIEGTDGVDAVVPFIQSISAVDPAGDGGELPVTVLGFDCRIEALVGSLGVPCSDEALAGLPGPLVGRSLAEQLEPGGVVRTSAGRVPLRAATPIDALDSINDGQVVAFPLAEALDVLGRDGRVDLAYVLLDDGVDVGTVQARLEQALPSTFAVLDALDPPPVVGVVLATFLPLFTVIALLTLGIGAVLVRNSITLSLEERRRQTAIVAALGGSRGLLVWGTVIEVVVLGFVGGLIGVAGGALLAGPVAGGLDQVLRDVAGIPLEISVPANAVVVGLVLGMGVAVGAAIGPARRAVRLDVAAELASRGRREEELKATSWPRFAAAFLVSGFGVLLTEVASYEAGIDPNRALLGPIGFLLSATGAVLVVAVVVPFVVRSIERRFPVGGATARLALSNLRREPKRSAVMAIALGFAMGVGFITASFKASVTQAITDSLDGNLRGVQVSAIDPDNSAVNEARLGPDVLEALEALPEVRSVERSAFVVLGNESGTLIGVQAYTEVWEATRPAAGEFSRAALAEGQVAIGPALARDEELRPGDELTLATPDGEVQLPIMAVMYTGNFGGRNVEMDYDLLLSIYGDQAPVSVIVNPAAGVTEDELLAAIDAADLDPGLHVEGKQAVIDRNAAEVNEQLSTFDAIQRGLLVMSFVAVLSTLLLVGVQRRKEFGMLAAVGMTPPELRRMVVTEALLIGVIGVTVTGGAALAQFYALNQIVPVIIGWENPLVVDAGAYLTYSLVAVVTAFLASLYPGLRASRVEVLEALRYE